MICDLTRRAFLKRTTMAAGATLAMPGALRAELPEKMQWTAADVGSSGYIEATAVANALIEQHGSRIRVVPSGTSVGRMMMLKSGRVSLGYLANEAYFATEALFDFSTREWGPQDLRALMGREALFGIVTTGDGPKTIADLKGKRVAKIQAHPSTNFKIAGVLAFAGLTWDDVEAIEVPGYSQGLQAVLDGTVEAAGAVVGASILREIEASPKGIGWLPVPADDATGWERINNTAPLFAPSTMTQGPGATPEAPVPLVGYRYPILSVFGETPEDEVYDITKAIVEGYPLYKDAAPVMVNYDPNKAGHPPYDSPCHDGAKRYFEEIGVWTEADEVWNTKRLARLASVQEAWTAATEAADDQGLADKDWSAFWDEFRAKHL
ncbi:TAXI family TRAP transporter solute-binding subunit [Puniceibacterium sp. IMCC21224]|uniref:TAXI family TRAP transporter solute-binding subunit n=1 Tax=Puniceibacterium sp. IMCC21224 TaxID=1618204 RepID=UPI00065CF7CA|nr:TAXI family TRAP transporter solute-binding subunit [Puniceibacterium sp. IMCC21224]KMK65127.1 TRAP transporter solute receptor, TAXI family [Puniceibacterium sp. IMCC21224]